LKQKFSIYFQNFGYYLTSFQKIRHFSHKARCNLFYLRQFLKSRYFFSQSNNSQRLSRRTIDPNRSVFFLKKRSLHCKKSKNENIFPLEISPSNNFTILEKNIRIFLFGLFPRKRSYPTNMLDVFARKSKNVSRNWDFEQPCFEKRLSMRITGSLEFTLFYFYLD